jgi:hypothetical protein
VAQRLQIPVAPNVGCELRFFCARTDDDVCGEGPETSGLEKPGAICSGQKQRGGNGFNHQQFRVRVIS